MGVPLIGGAALAVVLDLLIVKKLASILPASNATVPEYRKIPLQATAFSTSWVVVYGIVGVVSAKMLAGETSGKAFYIWLVSATAAVVRAPMTSVIIFKNDANLETTSKAERREMRRTRELKWAEEERDKRCDCNLQLDN